MRLQQGVIRFSWVRDVPLVLYKSMNKSEIAPDQRSPGQQLALQLESGRQESQ